MPTDHVHELEMRLARLVQAPLPLFGVVDELLVWPNTKRALALSRARRDPLAQVNQVSPPHAP